VILDQSDRTLAWQRFDVNIAVEAGAGTGKTRVLVDRYLAWTLAEGWRRGCDDAVGAAASILAITFTEKAAGEMQQRIIRSLRVIAGAHETRLKAIELKHVRALHAAIAAHWELTPELVRERAQSLLAASHRMEVSTIHAFAANLLHSWPLEAGIHPEFQVDSDGLRRRGWIERAVVEHTRRGLRGERAADYARLLTRLGPDTLCALVLALVDSSFDGRLAPPPQVPDFSADCHWLAERLEAIRPQAGKNQINKLERIRLALCATADSERHGDRLWHNPSPLLSQDEKDAFATLSKELKSYPPIKLAAALGEDAAAFNERSTRVHQVVRDMVGNDHGLFTLVCDLYLPLVESERQQLRTRGWLSYDDLLRFSAELLTSNRHVRRALAARYGQVLVDEFQDTSQEQCEILRGIMQGDPDTARLFVVGDPKQSIYAFRNAELSAYSDFAGALDLSLKLQMSFRSQERVVSALNAGFDTLFEAQERVQPAAQPLIAYNGPAGDGPAVRILRSDDAANANEAREWEAGAIVRSILEIDALGEARDGKRWSRFGVLSRVQSQAGIVMEALERAGIPAVVSGDKEFYRRQEVVDAINLLRVITNPCDDIAWVGLLRCPIGACSDQILLQLAQANFFGTASRKAAIEKAALRAPNDRAELLRVELLLDRVIELGHALIDQPIDIWPHRLLSTFPIRELYAAQYLGERKTANVLRVIHSFCDTLMSGVQPINEWLSDAAARLMGGVEQSESALADETTDAVRVMSIHASKGLEFEHVFVTRLDWNSSGPPSDKPYVKAGPDGWVLGAGGIHTWGKDALSAREAAIADAENVRLLYVACTRAEQSLTLMGRLKKQGLSTLVKRGFSTLDADLVSDQAIVEYAPSPEGGVARATLPTVELIERAPGWWQARQAQIATIGAAIRTASHEIEQSPPRRAHSGGMSGGASLGTEVHRLLETWDGHDIDLSNASADARELVLKLRRSPLAHRVAAATQRFQEYAFLAADDAADVAIGSVDLLMQEAKGWTIVDYKTNWVASQAEAEQSAVRYQEQAGLYIDAIKSALNIEQVRFEFWYLRGPFAVALDA
jgi:ATP-dependent helicase/nuclease subunit A